jgi:DNA modification methylase
MIKLINGFFEETDIGVRPKLTVADPPDNLGKKYDGVSDKCKPSEFVKKLENWIVKCCEVTDGPVFFIPNQKWMGDVECIIKQRKLRLVERIIWRYTFGQYQQKRYAICFRPIYWLNDPTIYPELIKVPSARQSKYKDKRAKPGGKLPDNIWEFPVVCGTYKERRNWHKCQLPLALIDRIVLGHSLPNDLVFDPFLGSGTTAIASKIFGRDFIGIDASATYVKKVGEFLASIPDVAATISPETQK